MAKTKILKKSLRYLITHIPGGVTAAKGFSAAGVRAGIKTEEKDDLALLSSATGCTAAGTFTTNAIRASSVDWCEKLLPSDGIRAVVANSGCANACTGAQGEKDTARTAELAGLVLRVPPEAVLVASTGMIGKFLPMEKIADGLRQAVTLLSPDGGTRFARAIMTTDTAAKEAAVRVKMLSGNIVIGGCVKGSGMICPNMATMLAFITTDARVAAGRLSAMVRRAVDRTFNNLTVDGDTSTNDMVLVLAGGASGLSVSSEPETQVFEEGLFEVCSELCRKIAADGEGATKRVEITISGAGSEAGARRAAKAVANSNLVKCALFGNNPNWGRIACAVGYSGTAFSREKMSISICGVTVFRNLQPAPFDEKKVSKLLSQKVVAIDINLGCGEKSAVAHTCDFSYDYVKINAEYHT
ncbi:MAG: bifunctional glutamate N-acetyltransferase/amino-acid acetyltransferase ArgJ [Chitinispirillaceae bacterium]|nr:bifunctional glutamate N-acetyltransferase/amino-acid acetyltransferase ArgJ [Chitinispirillaceae bacterium]